MTDRRRPAIGALLVATDVQFCTLGFNVDNTTDADFYFVTNSHCTNVQGGEENTVFYQADEPDEIGLEVLDPPYTNGAGCPPNRLCRRSDAALVRVNGAGDWAHGLVARPSAYGRWTGPSTLHMAGDRVAGAGWWGHPFYSSPTPFVGMTLEEVGAATGWTHGPVTNTCINVDVIDENGNDTGMTLLCQVAVAGGGAEGDSGAPVIIMSNLNDQNSWEMPVGAHFYGVLWGVNDTGTEFVFSGLPNVSAELGANNWYCSC